MADETFVQIEVPRTGQKIRNISVTTQQADGTTATALMQVIALADSDGHVLSLDALDALGELLLVAQQQRTLLQLLVNGLLGVNVKEKDL